MTTMERQRDDTRTTSTHATSGRRNWILVVLGLVLALVVGGLAGYLIRGDDTDDIGAVVPAGDTELTARVEEMGDLMAEYERAWHESDGEAAEALFAPGGTLTALGETYSADAGAIADFIGLQEWVALHIHEPMLVDGNTALNFHTYDGLRMNVFTFTADGELQIVSHVISDALGG